MKASGTIGSSGVYVSDNVEQRFETDIHTYIRNKRKRTKVLLSSLLAMALAVSSREHETHIRAQTWECHAVDGTVQ